MKVYFYSKKENDKPEQPEAHQAVLKFLKDNGVVVLSNLLAREEDELTFEKMDGLVVEGRSSAPEVGYLVALSLAQAKPILYLLPKGSMIPDQVRALVENQKLKRLFMLKHYSLKNLESFLIDFIDIIEPGELRREVPTVKFTLRFTPRADRYLTWIGRNKKIKKADFLRKLIDGQIQNNEEYQSYLRRPKEESEESVNGNPAKPD